MSNAANSGTVLGRLASDPVKFINSDGSKKVKFSIYVDRNFVSRVDNKRHSDLIPLEALVSANTTGGGIFGRLHKGDQALFATELRNEPYEKNGKTVYDDLKVTVQEVTFIDSRQVAESRLLERVSKGEITLEEDGFAVRVSKGGAAQGPAAEAPVSSEADGDYDVNGSPFQG